MEILSGSSYTGKVGDNVFDTTDEDEAKKAGIHSASAVYGPVTICVGQKHVIVGLDEELVGKKAGAKGSRHRNAREGVW